MFIQETEYAQMRNLISILDNKFTIIINGNTFYNNTGVKGQVFIQSSFTRATPVLISSNTFNHLGSYFSTNGIFIRATSPNRNISTTETANLCGNYYLYSNSFTEVLGCFPNATASIEFICTQALLTT